MNTYPINLSSSNLLEPHLQKHSPSLSLLSSSQSRLKQLTAQITQCCNTELPTTRKRPSLYERVNSYQSNLEVKAKMEQEQELLKKKLSVYKKELGRIQYERKINVKELLRSWSLSSSRPRSRNNSLRLNTVCSKNARYQNLQTTKTEVLNYKTDSKVLQTHVSFLTNNSPSNVLQSISEKVENPTGGVRKSKVSKKSRISGFLPKKSKFFSRLFCTAQSSFINQNKQNKLLSMLNKEPSKIPTKISNRTHSPQYKGNSFLQRRSNAYSVLFQRGRSITRMMKQQSSSPKQVFKIEAHEQITRIMNNTTQSLKDKMNKLMDIKIKINNIEPNELKDGGIGRRVKESMVELYYNILDKSK